MINLSTVDNQTELSTLLEMANKQIQIENRILKTEAILEKRKELLKLYSEKMIPDYMEQIGIPEFKTDDGFVIGVKSSIHCNITEMNRAQAYLWLENNGAGDLIKRKLSVDLGKDQKEEADSIRKVLEEKGLLEQSTFVPSIHPLTLNSFVKKSLEEGENIPMDLFDVFNKKVAKIKTPKK